MMIAELNEMKRNPTCIDNITHARLSQTTIPDFKAKHAKVKRVIDDFTWLHGRLSENKDNAGVIVSSRQTHENPPTGV